MICWEFVSAATRPGTFSHPRTNWLLLLLLATATAFNLTGCAKKVSVPDFSQQDLDSAQKAITAAGLKPGAVSGATGAGAYVTSQTPAAGQQVSANSKVDLVVELPVVVPNLSDSNITDAVSMLQGLGLKVAFVKKSAVNPFGKAKVEAQDPAANASVHHTAVVTLTVSTPPDISGLLGMAAQEPAYKNLKPQYKNILDAFLGNPNTPRSMEPGPSPANDSSAPKQ